MTTLFGNICLILSAMVSSAIIASVWNYKAPIGGSGGAEAFPIWIMLIHFALLVTLALATIVVAQNGGFDWISPYRLVRYPLVIIGFCMAIITSLFSAFLVQQSGGLPAFLLALIRYAYIYIPIILIASGFILLHSGIRQVVPSFCYTWPLSFVFAVGMLVLGSGVFEWITKGSENPNASQQQYENAKTIKNMRLKEIAESDASENMVRLLEFTGMNYAPEVREKAAVKVKSDPAWQQRVIEVLESDNARAAFNFLALNDVPDKNKFLVPVDSGIMAVAYWIRHTNQGTSPSAYHSSEYSNEVNRVLESVEKFEGMGVDYLPAVRAMRDALDEPLGGEQRRFDCIGGLDNWIKQRE